jgi:predicted lipoprotein with Yx(FWY)xxD motif
MRHAKFGIALTLALLAALALVACGGTSAGVNPGAGSAGGTPQVKCASAGATICTKDITVGNSTETVFATNDGKTLYYFMLDKADRIACTGSCTSLWPPLKAPSATVSDSFGYPGSITVLSGANGTQFAYKGHPLYNYSQDASSTDARGEGVDGQWFVATPDLAPLSAGTPTTGGGYGGYGDYP